MNKFLYYLPRILAIIIVCFLALFIGEGFDPEFGWQSGVMHGLMALGVLVMTIVAWKWPKYGGWLFVCAGLAYLIMILSTDFSIGVSYIWIGLVPLFTGILFLVEAFNRSKQIKLVDKVSSNKLTF